VDDGAQPKPRATTARTPKRAAPSDPRTDDGLRKRTTGTRTSKPTVTASTSPLMSTGSVVEDPVLPPVDEGTPIEIPRIVPAEVDDDDLVWGSSDATNGTARSATVIGLPSTDDDHTSDLPRPPEFTDVDGTDGLPSLYKPKKPARALRPVTLPKAGRPRVRRVTRVVRTIDTWSVFKVALCFSLFLYAVCLTAGVLLWQVAQNTGTVDNVERFFESFGWQTFQLKGGTIYHNAWVGGLFAVVGLTGLCVLSATMFNLIADLVGGVRVTVLEEEVIAREDRGLGWRRAIRREPVPVDEPASHGSAPFPGE
jgi:hypothetical protein